MKTQIENSIYNEGNLASINGIITECVAAKTEKDLRTRMKLFEEYNTSKAYAIKHGLDWGFGHTHFWLSEVYEVEQRPVGKRILFVDFNDQ